MTESVAASLTITDPAIAAVKEALREEKLEASTTYLRVSVRAGGCSGYSYELEFTQDVDPEDRVIERDGVRLLLDPRSEIVLKGTELDFSSGLNGKGFVFNNPNATGTCGCGESFSV